MIHLDTNPGKILERIFQDYLGTCGVIPGENLEQEQLPKSYMILHDVSGILTRTDKISRGKIWEDYAEKSEKIFWNFVVVAWITW